MITVQHDVEVGDAPTARPFWALQRHFSLTEGSPLLGQAKRPPRNRQSSIVSWLRNWTYCVGGGMFTCGTLLLYVLPLLAKQEDETVFLGEASAWMYIVGSAAFLCMDAQALLLVTTHGYGEDDDDDDRIRNKNDDLLVSMLASLLYLIGSVGFLPENYSSSPLVGMLGLWLASLLTVGSQARKIVRILVTPTKDASRQQQQRNKLFVEAGDMVGGLGFWIGTSLFWKGQGTQMSLASSQHYDYVLTFWLLGSLGFVVGGFVAAQSPASAG